MKLRAVLNRLWWDESGPTAVEYAVMLFLIVITCIGTIHLMAQATEESFSSSTEAINNAVN